MDILTIDQLGKNISGAGIDPNVVGRGVQGYSSALNDRTADPIVRRVFVRDLTPETHGNGIGIGMADFTTSRLVAKLDKKAVFINSLTSLTPHAAKIPMHFDADEEVLTNAVASLALEAPATPRMVRIRDTLSLETIECTENFLPEIRKKPELEIVGQPWVLKFDNAGNLPEIGRAH